MPGRGWLFFSHLGVGLLPGPTGTYGSALGVGLFALAHCLWPGWGGWLVLAGAVILGLPVAGRAEKVYGHDAGQIVIDEVAGQALSLSLVLVLAPLSWLTVAAGFFLFRFLDIIKCRPMSWAERLPGGLGVMADDLLAGLLAGLGVGFGWQLLTHLGLWPA